MFQVIQASLAFAQLTVAELLSFLNAVYARMKDNPAFTVNLPFDMAIFKAAIDSFTSAVDAALDGSKKAMAERNRQREVVIKMLRQLAHYVEAASKDDVSDRKSTRLNSSHPSISYAVFCLKKKMHPVRRPCIV